MSWNSFTITDLEIKASEVKINLTWTCPRCDCQQPIELPPRDLLCGIEVHCSNTYVCGERQSYFSLRLDLEYGSYKGVIDRPLIANSK